MHANSAVLSVCLMLLVNPVAQVREVARAIARTGENPARYLLAMKYLDALRDIIGG